MNNSKSFEDRVDEFFPHSESYEDTAGKKREFILSLHPVSGGGGYVVTATEKNVEDGYEFDAYTETNPFDALGRVRSKIKEGLATKYLIHKHGNYSPRFDEVRGRISAGGLVVDGIYLSFQEFSEMLQTYEGFSFGIKITDSST